MTQRIHITGGSGSGTTTLGAHLALALRLPHHDTDDFYWMPTDTPYSEKRPIADRLALMSQMFLPREGWVLSGALMGWGDPLVSHFDLIIFLGLPQDIRLARLKAREKNSYGARIGPGGDLERAHRDFMIWAQGYDQPDFHGRSHRRLQSWCDTLSCRVLTLDSSAPVADLLAAIREQLP
jgi:adenylate kinase family enzyme